VLPARCRPRCGFRPLHRACDHSPQRRSHLADGCGQGIQPSEAAGGGSVAHSAFAPGHPHDPPGTAHGLRRARRPDPGPDRVQHNQGSRGLASGSGLGPAAADPRGAASGVHPQAADSARLVGRGPHTTRLASRRPARVARPPTVLTAVLGGAPIRGSSCDAVASRFASPRG
jgi:hypothetical protein